MNQHFQEKVSNHDGRRVVPVVTAPPLEFSDSRGNIQLCKITSFSGIIPFRILDAWRFLWAGVRLSWVDPFQTCLAPASAESF